MLILRPLNLLLRLSTFLLASTIAAQASSATMGTCAALRGVFNDFRTQRPQDEVTTGRRLPQGPECRQTYFYPIEPTRCVTHGGVLDGKRFSVWSVDFAWQHQSRDAAVVQALLISEELKACRGLQRDESGEGDINDARGLEYEVTYKENRQGDLSGKVEIQLTDVPGNQSNGTFWTFVTVTGFPGD